MTREAFAAFPTVGIPRFLEARCTDPQQRMALLYRALDESLRLLATVEFARHLAPEATDGDEGLDDGLTKRLAALRLCDTGALLGLAREQAREACAGFPSLLPGDDDSEVWDAIDAWLAHREVWLSGEEIPPELSAEGTKLRAPVGH